MFYAFGLVRRADPAPAARGWSSRSWDAVFEWHHWTGLAVHLFLGEDLFCSSSVPRGLTQLRADLMLRESQWWYCTLRRMSALIRLKFTPNKIKSAVPSKPRCHAHCAGKHAAGALTLASLTHFTGMISIQPSSSVGQEACEAKQRVALRWIEPRRLLDLIFFFIECCLFWSNIS